MEQLRYLEFFILEVAFLDESRNSAIFLIHAVLGKSEKGVVNWQRAAWDFFLHVQELIKISMTEWNRHENLNDKIILKIQN